MVRLQSFPDDLRGAAINPNARIVIPGRYAESSRLAKVLTLGDGRMRNGETHIFSVQVGDTVLCTRYPKTAQSFKWNDEEVLLVSEWEILAKVNYAE